MYICKLCELFDPEKKEIIQLIFLCPMQILNIKCCVINNLYSRKEPQKKRKRKEPQDQAPDKKVLGPEILVIFQKCPKLYNKVDLTRTVFNLHLPPGYLFKPAYE